MRNFGRWISAGAVAALLAVPTSALGQSASDDAAGSAGASSVEAPIEASTTYAYPVSDSFPAGVLGIANPSLVCIFMPCPPEAADLMAAISDPLGTTRDVHGQATPIQAVQPGTIAMSLSLGATQYQSAIKFELPARAAGEQFDAFHIGLAQTDPTFNANSPTFRAAVDAVFMLYRDENPEAAAGKLQEGLTSTPVDQKVLEIRACPLRAPFVPTEAPAVAQGSDVPHDEYGAVDIACHLGAFGEYDGDGGWTFDLTRAANAWADGELENNGVFLMPVVTNYLGIGDEDPSTNAQVTLFADNVVLESTTRAASPAFTYPEAPAPSSPSTGPGAPSAGTTPNFTSPTFTSPTAPSTPDAVVPDAVIAPQEPEAPITVFEPAAAGGFDLDQFAAAEIPDWVPLTALIIITASGTGAYNWVRRRRARPRRVLAAA